MAETKKYLDFDGLKVYHEMARSEIQKKTSSNYLNTVEMVWGTIIKEMYENYVSSNDWIPISDYITKNQEEINGILNLFNNYDYSSLNDAIYASNSYLLTTIANFTNGMFEEMGEQFAKKGEVADVDLSNYIAKNTVIETGNGEKLNVMDSISFAYDDASDYYTKFYISDDSGDDTTPIINKILALWNFYNDNKDKDFALKSEVVDLDTLKQVVAEAPHIKKEKVETLPPEADGVENVLYLVPRSNTEDGDYFDQYLLIDGKWDPIGSTKTNLANYISKDDIVLSKWENDYTTQEAIEFAATKAVDAYNQITTLWAQLDIFDTDLRAIEESVANASGEVESISNQEIDALFA